MRGFLSADTTLVSGRKERRTEDRRRGKDGKQERKEEGTKGKLSKGKEKTGRIEGKEGTIKL